MRRFLVLLVAATMVLCLLPARAAEASVSRLTVTFYGDPQTTRGFTWYTSSAEGSEVQIYADSNPEAAVTYYGYSGAAVNETGEYWHKAAITDLTPGTVYTYRVGWERGNVWSEWYSFETALDTQTFSFIALTDTQAALQWHGETSANTLRVALDIAPDAAFVIHSGDVVDKGRDETMWQMTLDAARENLGKTVLVPAAGNHEPSIGTWAEHFNLPLAQGCNTVTGGYYSFTYGSVHIVTLNTNESGGDISNLSNAQLQWLQEDISAARAAGAKRIVVSLHKGMYSLGPYALGADIVGTRGQRTKLAPLLESLGVDLVLQGHDHVASRTYPLWNGQPARLGVTYLNTGTAGVKAYQINENLSASYLDLFAYKSQTRAVYGRYQYFAVLHVDAAANLSGELYLIDSETDSSNPVLVDEFYLPTPVRNAGNLPFRDISVADDFVDAVVTLYDQGIMTGTGEDIFEPDTPLSRAMLVTLLHRLAGEPESPPATAFPDVETGRWYTHAVSWASGEGYVQGYDNGLFGTNDDISREQLAVILHRYAASIGLETTSAARESAASPWAQTAFSWAVEQSLLSPENPTQAATRAEAAVALAALQQG